MRNIVVLGAGRSATVLIRKLLDESTEQNWHVHVGDMDRSLAEQKTGGHPRAIVHRVDPSDPDQLRSLIDLADAVISMLPPPFHYDVAVSCLQHRKHFLNASYLTEELKSLHGDVLSSNLTFLCEIGLDPGIDHMSAMEMINGIRAEGGEIFCFRSHCGGLVSPESDDNPWHYKISWNSRNILLAGKDGAVYVENGQRKKLPYAELFDPLRLVEVPEMGSYAWYPNRDSLAYLSLYGIEGVPDFVRTTLRHPLFCHGWRKLVQLGLTSEVSTTGNLGKTMCEFFHPLIGNTSNWDDTLRAQFHYLELESEELITRDEVSCADLLQSVLEQKLRLLPNDRDMIIMLHELGYQREGETNRRWKKASLVVKGDNATDTAMAKTVGLPLAIAVKAVLNGKISRRGVFIPVYKDVYKIVLGELEKQGINFLTTEQAIP